MTDPIVRIVLTVLLVVAFAAVVTWIMRDLDAKKKFTHWRQNHRLKGYADRAKDLMDDHTNTSLHLALLEREMAEFVRAAPREFVNPLIKTIQLGRGVQAAMLVRAKEMGVYDPSILDVEGLPVEELAPRATPLRAVGASEPPMVFTEDGTRLVPRSGR